MPYYERPRSIDSDTQAWLTDLEAEIGPLRVLNGRMVQGTIEPWTQEQADSCGVSLDVAMSQGFTIVNGGSLHDVEYTNLDDFPSSTGGFRLWDALRPIEPSTHALPWTILNFSGTDDLLVGEITDRTLLTYYPFLQHQPDTWDLDKLIREPLLASVDDEQFAEFSASLIERNRTQFVEYASRATNDGIEEVRRKIGDLMRAETLRREQLAVNLRELRNNQRQLDAMLAARNESDEDIEDRLARAWDALHEDPRVRALTFSTTGTQLIIDTEPLNLVHPHDGREVYLGQFRVEVSLTDTTCRIHNTDNARGNHDHPHVSNGNPCFGEMGTTIYELITVGDLPAAIEMIFVFLTSVNLDDEWGRTGAYWFEDETNTPRYPEVAA